MLGKEKEYEASQIERLKTEQQSRASAQHAENSPEGLETEVRPHN